MLNSVSRTITIGTISSMSSGEIMHSMYPLKCRIDPSATEICKPRVDYSFNSSLSNKGLYRFSDNVVIIEPLSDKAFIILPFNTMSTSFDQTIMLHFICWPSTFCILVTWTPAETFRSLGSALALLIYIVLLSNLLSYTHNSVLLFRIIFL